MSGPSLYPWLYLGLDLGQRRDHSAIAVVERRDAPMPGGGMAFHSVMVRHLERLRLGTPYPAVVERVREVVYEAQRRGRCTVVADATGVGAPVVDLLRSAKLGAEVIAVAITGGEQETGSGNLRSVPKKDLMAVVQVLLQRREIRIARRLPEAGRLTKELMDIRVTAGRMPGKVRMGADGAGEHDDLAIALALACWKARPKRVGTAPEFDPVLRFHCRVDEYGRPAGG